MGGLNAWTRAPARRRRRPRRGRAAEDGWWRTGLKPAVDLDALRRLPALLALLPGLGDRARRYRLRGLRPRPLQGLRALRGRLPDRRDRDGARCRLSSPQLLTGGEAVVEAMRQIDPDVVPIYPITPQTPIIQGFAKAVADGRAHGELIDVESEHSAMSAAIAAALAGARTMTATSSQGLALMAEIVYIAASMRAPIVMALGNRALSGPINIHCDHSDSMLIRDSGAIQLFAENAQEAYDLTVIAPRLAEHPDVLLPVIGLPGRLHDHALRRASRPARRRRRCASSWATTGIPYPLLDLRRPTTQGPFAMPDYYFELRRATDRRDRVRARRSSRSSAGEYGELSGRSYGSVEPYRLDDAERALVCLGSTAGTAKDVVDDLRAEGRARRAAEDLLLPAVPGRDPRAPARRTDDRRGARPRRLSRAASRHSSPRSRRALPGSPALRSLRLRARRS